MLNMKATSKVRLTAGRNWAESKLKAGEKTPVLRLPDGALVLMLCGKRTRSLGLPSREDVQVNLVQREADILARRYLRELRQNAIIQSFEDQS